MIHEKNRLINIYRIYSKYLTHLVRVIAGVKFENLKAKSIRLPVKQV